MSINDNNFKNIPEFPREISEPVYNCGDGAFMKLYRNTEKMLFDKYIGELVSSGFTVYAQNCIEQNYFYTLLKDSLMLQAYYTQCDNSVHLVYDYKTALYESGSVCLEQKYETVFYQFETDHTYIDCGMCYITQCADGSFFIIDSAHFLSMNDNDRIHKFLRDRTPAGEKIIIAGWYFSHCHDDHVSKFMDFLKYNCDDVIIEKLYYNFIPTSHPDSIHWADCNKIIMNNFNMFIDTYDNIPKVRLHTGQRFYVRNLMFDVLCTHEDVYPESVIDYNISSAILMMTVEGTKIFIPGDASGPENSILLSRYGNYLKSDIVQVAHHGHFGLSTEAYETIDADILLFPTTQIKYDEEFVVYEANRRAVELCKEYYISSNGTVEIPLPFKSGNINVLPDETFEDFYFINRLWNYEYTEERKKELFEAFLAASQNNKKQLYDYYR